MLPRRRALSALGACVAVAVSASCSAVIGIDGLVADRDVSTDGGDAGDGRAPDARDQDAADAAPDAAPGATCATPHDLCDDFDTVPLGDPSRWTQLSTTSGGLLRRATDLFVSAPASLWATFPAFDAGDTSPDARLTKTVAGSVVGSTCAFDLRVAQVDTQLIVWTFELAPAPDAGTDGWWIEWQLEGSQSRVSAIGTTTAGGWNETGDYFGLPPLGTWVHVVVNVTSTSVAITFDGNPVVSTPIALPSNTGAAFDFGAWTRDAVSAANDVHIDDVVCDVKR